ncbi:hypothetical protein ACHAWF_001150 [Thalassiosira exigua]
MTCTHWRTKPSSEPKSEIFVSTKPDEVVSVNQMVSTLHGFVVQMTGKLIKRRYSGETVFVDNFSRLKFVFLMESNFISDDTIRVKEAFERFARDHGVTNRHYHTTNGQFKANAFIPHCNKFYQLLSFCGVDAHF